MGFRGKPTQDFYRPVIAGTPNAGNVAVLRPPNSRQSLFF